MKIVHVEDFIHPDAGYQVNMLGRLQSLQGHSVHIVAGELEKIPDFLKNFFGADNINLRDEIFHQETDAQIHRIPLHGFYSGRAFFHLKKLFEKISQLKPDVVFVHGEDTLTGIIFILLSRWLPYPIVLDCHMLEMASKNRFREVFRFFYRKIITPIILKRNIPLIRVVDSDFVQKCLGIPLNKTHYLSLGTDTDYFKPNIENKESLRKELGISEKAFLVIYAGKLDEHKGGIFFSEALIDNISNSNGEDIEFLVIGSAVGNYGQVVEANFLKSRNKIIRLNTQRYFDLAKFFQIADLAIFPKQCSMSFFEAQSCGLPVLFEMNEINSIRIKDNNAFTFESGSIDSFRERIKELAATDSDIYHQYRVSARNFVLSNYNFVPISVKYSDVLQDEFLRWTALHKK